jgi:tetrahydromethanopterin S-methyltransferase subunit B
VKLTEKQQNEYLTAILLEVRALREQVKSLEKEIKDLKKQLTNQTNVSKNTPQQSV